MNIVTPPLRVAAHPEGGTQLHPPSLQMLETWCTCVDPRTSLIGIRVTDEGEEMRKYPGTRKFGEGWGELRDPQLGPLRTAGCRRTVGGAWGTRENRRIREAAKQAQGLTHAGTHTALARKTGNGRVKPTQRSWGGRKKQKDKTGR